MKSGSGNYKLVQTERHRDQLLQKGWEEEHTSDEVRETLEQFLPAYTKFIDILKNYATDPESLNVCDMSWMLFYVTRMIVSDEILVITEKLLAHDMRNKFFGNKSVNANFN
jgi:hypothetical protein